MDGLVVKDEVKKDVEIFDIVIRYVIILMIVITIVGVFQLFFGFKQMYLYLLYG